MHRLDPFGKPLEIEYPEEGMGTTFYYPEERVESKELLEVVEWDAIPLLPTTLEPVVPSHVKPIRVMGDGNCLLRAISMAVWGVESYYSVLRESLVVELRTNFEWYIESTKETSTEEKEWTEYLATALTPSAYLGAAHMFALANLMERTIVLYASDNLIEAYGATEDGVAGTFLPTRIEKEKWLNKPIIPISWSNDNKNHFIPLIGIENRMVEWPLMDIAFKQNSKVSTEELNEIFKSTNRIPPAQVEKLRNGTAPLNHLSFFSAAHNNNNLQESGESKILSINGQQFLVQDSDLRTLGLQSRPCRYVYLNGKYLELERSATPTQDIDAFLERYDLNPVIHRQKMVPFAYQDGYGYSDAVRMSDQSQKVSKDMSTHYPLRRDWYEYFPLKRYQCYNRASPLAKVSAKITKDFKLSKEDQKFLQSITDIIQEYAAYAEANPSDLQNFEGDIPLACYDLLVRCLKGSSDIVFPIIDLFRFLVIIPKVALYLAAQLESVDQPHNLFASILPQLQFLNQKNCKSIVFTYLRLLLNMIFQTSFHSALLTYFPVILLSIDKCISADTNNNLYGKTMVYLAKLLSENKTPQHVKIQTIYLCVKLLGIFQLCGVEEAKAMDVAVATNSDCLQAIGTLLYHDPFLQEHILHCHVRWPIKDILEMATARARKEDEKMNQLVTIATDLLAMLGKPSISSLELKETLSVLQK